MAKKVTGSKSTAWNAFARWVRVSGCISTTGYAYVGVCITCDNRFHISALQAGHCFGGRHNGILFHEELTNLQCVICNERFHGKLKKYRKIMVKRYDEQTVAEWEIESKKPVHNRDMNYGAIAKDYKNRTNELLKPFGYHSFEDMLHGHQL